LINSYNSEMIIVNKCGHTFIEMSHTLCISCSKRFKQVKRFYCTSISTYVDVVQGIRIEIK